MPSARDDPALAGDETIHALLRPVRALMVEFPDATEISMSEPGWFHVAAGGQWTERHLPAMTAEVCLALAEAISYYARQELREGSPILSTSLPTGERIQIVIPPACDPQQIGLSIRIPSSRLITLDQYEAEGTFSRFLWAQSPLTPQLWPHLDPQDQHLLDLLRERRLREFLIAAVLAEKNIAVVGDTGSGKTTLMKALCAYIPPHERLVTIEDTRELALPWHANKAHLLYAKGGQAGQRVSPSDLIAASMRLFPDRVLLAELRGAEAWDFLKLMTTGHRGSLTSFHAESATLALDRWVFMARENPEAATAAAQDIKRLVALTVDVILHITARTLYDPAMGPTGVSRYVTEVSFDPAHRWAHLADAPLSTGLEQPGQGRAA